MDTFARNSHKATLASLGLARCADVYPNLGTAALYEQAMRRGEVRLAEGGAMVALTDEHTGRSPNDKYFVDEPSSTAAINWGTTNRRMGEPEFDRLLGRVSAYLQDRDLFLQDLHVGASAEYRLPVRVITQTAWHSLFARNMFLRPMPGDLGEFAPAFTVLHAPGFKADPGRDATRSEVFVAVHLARGLVLIGGTAYAGEIKKSIFSVMNYLLPARGVLPMHCSANQGRGGDTAIFFGLSGTGKTTLSADASRILIGDDEHGWGENGVFNFEGGCYAKVIKLSPQAEPEIFATTHRFGTILENVVIDPASHRLDLDDDRYTENTRASYPLEFIPNASPTGAGALPRNVIMLTADAFGVLPPISRLSSQQAMYHFLSGYTARIAGTERGVGEPQATFSPCFGAPFLPRHPSVYAAMLGEKIGQSGVTCWLVNTGWSGGAYGVGQRMAIAHTRALLRAVLDGRLAGVAYAPEPFFGLSVPESCPDVPEGVLLPRQAWADGALYDTTAHEVAARFKANFAQYEGTVSPEVQAVAL